MGAKRLTGMRDFALEAYFSRWSGSVRHNLAASDSETVGMADLLARADPEDAARWQDLRLAYTAPRGAPWLRQTIAEGYEAVAPDDIVCFAGAGEGIHVAMHALLGRDDHAIVIVPNYQSAETIPRGLCAVSGVALDAARGWTLDIDAVADAFRPGTRLVAINFPNNPTGKILERDRFDALVALCRSRGAWLFSDEVYRLIERDPAQRLPQAADVYERGVSLNVLSKAYGLPGLRIGWIACRDRAVASRLERLKHYLSLCNSAPSEVLSNIALKSGSALLDRNRRLADRNLALVDRFFAAHPALFAWHRPEGGVIGYPRYVGAEGVEAFAQRLIERSGVLVLPASLFRSDLVSLPDDRFRIGFGRANLPESLDALERHLASARG